MPDLLDEALTVAEAAALWEAKYTAQQLRDMLGKGQATRNADGEPSYPIADVEDLTRAIRAVGRGGKDHDKIRAFIIKRAKALGKSDMVPAGWSTTGAAKESTGGFDSSRLTQWVAGQVGDGVIQEAGAVPAGQKGRRRRIQLIDAGWSKNGRYYPASTLAEAANARIYPAGTPMFIDHPTVSEQAERPERSVKDLAARLVTDARYENGRLVAEADLFGVWGPVINEIADQIGVSIRAAGTLEYGEAEGREGPIVTALTEGISVDFVTSPARGGKVLELVESARTVPLAEAANIGAWLEARLHLAFTQLADCMYGDGRLTRDERIGLSTAVGDALAAFVKRVEADEPQLYERDRWQAPPDEDDTEGDVAEAANAKQLAPPFGKKPDPADGKTATAEKTPAKGGKSAAEGENPGEEDDPAGKTTAKPAKGAPVKASEAITASGTSHTIVINTVPGVTAEDITEALNRASARSARPGNQNAPGSLPADTTPTKEEGSMPELTEAEARKLTEERDAALAEAETARNEAAASTAARTEADLKLARFTAAESARPIAAKLLAESKLPAAAQGRIIGQLVSSETVPLTSDSKLDESAFRASLEAAVKAEETYLASLAEQAGIGTPRGLGESTSPDANTAGAVPAEVTEGLIESYKQSGMSEAAAQLAAAGRPF